jgi:hypothetical protein
VDSFEAPILPHGAPSRTTQSAHEPFHGVKNMLHQYLREEHSDCLRYVCSFPLTPYWDFHLGGLFWLFNAVFGDGNIDANVLFRHDHQHVGTADVQALRPADRERLPA